VGQRLSDTMINSPLPLRSFSFADGSLSIRTLIRSAHISSLSVRLATAPPVPSVIPATPSARHNKFWRDRNSSGVNEMTNPSLRRRMQKRVADSPARGLVYSQNSLPSQRPPALEPC
jgi:hypothetical protein